MRPLTISPAVPCPAMARLNACCAAKLPKRSSACRPTSRKENLGLKVYDCYRPTRAVRAMADWAHDGDDSDATKRFYPGLQKRNLFKLGYIAAQSRHSTGTTVDLTLIKLPAAAAPRFDPTDPTARYGPCTGPANKRAPDNSIDMGTSFDCFDVKSYGLNKTIDPEQRRWRGVLNAAMRRHDFANYFREWWHYSFTGADEPRAMILRSSRGAGERAVLLLMAPIRGVRGDPLRASGFGGPNVQYCAFSGSARRSDIVNTLHCKGGWDTRQQANPMWGKHNGRAKRTPDNPGS